MSLLFEDCERFQHTRQQVSSQLISQYFQLEEYCWLEQTNLEPTTCNIKAGRFKAGYPYLVVLICSLLIGLQGCTTLYMLGLFKAATSQTFC